MKSAKYNNHHTTFVVIDNLCSKRNSMCIVLSAIRTCTVHKDWVKIVICTKEHNIYTILLQEMHKYSPKSPIIRNPIYVSESDDKSDNSSEDEYFVHELPLEQDVNEIEGSQGEVYSSVCTSEDDHDDDVLLYNLRSHGRHPSTRLKYHFPFSVLPL